jgi:hypothetical protein
MAYDLLYPSSLNEKLSDGDVIFTEDDPGSDPGSIQFTLHAGNSVTWWKGIILIYQDGSYQTIADLAGRPGATQTGLLPKDVLTNAAVDGLYLSKAKFLGIHDNTYKIDNAQSVFQNGRNYKFSWLSD